MEHLGLTMEHMTYMEKKQFIQNLEHAMLDYDECWMATVHKNLASAAQPCMEKRCFGSFAFVQKRKQKATMSMVK